MTRRNHLIELAREGVSSFAVLAEIQALLFFRFADAQSHHGFQHKKNDRTPGGCEEYGHADGRQLGYHQRRISMQQTVITGRIDGFGSEDTREYRSQDPSNAVHADNVERIVIS